MNTQTIVDLAQRHGATSYRNRADTQNPAYGFTEDGLVAFVQELLAGKCLQQIAEPATDLQQLIAEINTHMRAEWDARRLPAVCWPTDLARRVRDAAAGAAPVQAAPAAVAVPERWCPDVCPITGRRFFGWIEHWKTGQQVPTYGGPFDSYTIPVKDEDGTFSCERFDHDAGEWMTEGMGWCDLGLQLVDDQAFVVQPDNQRYDEIRDFAEGRAALAATPADHVADVGKMGAARQNHLPNCNDDACYECSSLIPDEWVSKSPAAAPVVLPAGWVAIPLEPTAEQWRDAQGTLLDVNWDAVTCFAARIQALIAITRKQWVSACAASQVQAEAWDALTPAARDVLAERQRQISAEGWTPAHDDEHGDGSMSVAAACYALTDATFARPNALSPGYLAAWVGWGSGWFKPASRRRNLEKAGALILAEIERIDRAAIAAAKGE